MKEEFLHFAWKYQLFDPGSLIDRSGNIIRVLNPGEYNQDAGPDFFNSRLIIDGTEWAGNVEIHIKASDFEAHGHHRDHAFDNVILHVVAVNDKRVRNARGAEVLTSEIVVPVQVSEKYINLINNPSPIACGKEIEKTDPFFLHSFLQTLMVERLIEKSASIMRIFKDTGNDWEETLYRLICRYFGFRVNTEPFEMLSRALPFRILKKHADNRMLVEALLFGTAGLLEEGLFRSAINDNYYLDLSREFRMLSAKYSLQPVHGWLWKFSRLRPVNFPTIRISQLAGLMCTAGGLFSRVTGTDDPDVLKMLFETTASPYWDDHYVFGKKSRPVQKRTGEMAMNIMMINTVIPVIFSYGKLRGDNRYVDRSLLFMEHLDAEENKIIDEWKDAGIAAMSASDTQALIHLRTNYCRIRRCLVCRLGQKIIASGFILKKPEETSI